MNNKQIKEKAEQAVRGQKGEIILSLVLSRLVAAIPLFGVIVSPVVKLGYMQNLDDVIAGKKINQKALYSKFKDQFGSSFLCGVHSLLVLAIAALITIILIVLLFFVPYLGWFAAIIIALIGLFVIDLYYDTAFYVLLREPNLDGDDAFRKGRKLVRKNEFQYIKLILSYLGVFILSALTAGFYYAYKGQEVEVACMLFMKELYNGTLSPDDPEAGTNGTPYTPGPGPAPSGQAPYQQPQYQQPQYQQPQYQQPQYQQTQYQQTQYQQTQYQQPAAPYTAPVQPVAPVYQPEPSQPAPVQAPVPEAFAPAAEPEATPAPSFKTCPKCGYSNDINSIFCERCGERIG